MFCLWLNFSVEFWEGRNGGGRVKVLGVVCFFKFKLVFFFVVLLEGFYSRRGFCGEKVLGLFIMGYMGGRVVIVMC